MIAYPITRSLFLSLCMYIMLFLFLSLSLSSFLSLFSSPSLYIYIYMALYKYPGYETGQGWTMKPGNLEGGFWGRYKGVLGAKPPMFAYWSPQNAPSRFPGSLSTPGLFHTLHIYTEPYICVYTGYTCALKRALSVYQKLWTKHDKLSV